MKYMPDPIRIYFETSWGLASIDMTDEGVVRVRLPDPEDQNAPTPLGDLSAEQADIIAEIRSYFDGQPAEFDFVRLDLSRLSGRERAIYGRLRAIPRGELITYGDLAKEAGFPGEAQAIGTAMGKNPWPLIVPCHRVVGSDGKLTGFSAPGGLKTKRRMLALENAKLPSDTRDLFG